MNNGNGENMEKLERPIESLWKVEDVASFLQTSKSWVYQRASAGEIPCRRIGGMLRFIPDEVRKWSEQPN